MFQVHDFSNAQGNAVNGAGNIVKLYDPLYYGAGAAWTKAHIAGAVAGYVMYSETVGNIASAVPRLLNYYGLPADFSVFVDYEADSVSGQTVNAAATQDIVNAVNSLAASGHKIGVYASKNVFDTYPALKALPRLWVAAYSYDTATVFANYPNAIGHQFQGSPVDTSNFKTGSLGASASAPAAAPIVQPSGFDGVPGLIPQNGTFRASANRNIRFAPSTETGEIGGIFTAGASHPYDSFIVADGWRWISFIGDTTRRRVYVAWATANRSQTFGECY